MPAKINRQQFLDSLRQGSVHTVAAKMYTPDMIYYMEEDPDLIGQLRAWDIYQKASLEARVMHQLSHPNILGLIGIALHPLSLLVELAPEGDLRLCVGRFMSAKVKLSRRTLQCTLIQVCKHWLPCYCCHTENQSCSEGWVYLEY